MGLQLAVSSSRKVAVDVLDGFDQGRHDAGLLLHEKLGQTERRGQATDIVFGVIRNRAVIDEIITVISKRAVDRIQAKLLNILRMGAYELIFAPQTAEYAIVNEAVNIANQVAGKRGAGFVNAVLRGICRSIQSRSVGLDEADLRRTLPQSRGDGCQFEIDILPDLHQRPGEYLSKAFSLPGWLVDKWLGEFGFEASRAICFGSNRRPGIFIRPNTLKVTAEELVERLEAEGVQCRFGADKTTIKINSDKPIFSLVGFGEGLFSVQDPTAAKAAVLLGVKPGQCVLDMCAAPGGKTVQMAQLMNNEGKIFATDIDAARLSKVQQNCVRLGVGNVQVVAYEEISGIGRADAVMLDVPCSNTGVLARRPEVRLRLRKGAPKHLAKTQLELFDKAAEIVSIGGRICYSTCSIMKEENSDVVKRFLARHREFELVCEELTLPGAETDSGLGHDGGYAAIVVKRSV